MTAVELDQIKHLDFVPTLSCERPRGCDQEASLVFRFRYTCDCPPGPALVCADCVAEMVSHQDDPLTAGGRCSKCLAPHGATVRRDWFIIDSWEPIK